MIRYTAKRRQRPLPGFPQLHVVWSPGPRLGGRSQFRGRAAAAIAL